MLTLHGPVVDGGLGNQGDGVEVDPLPERDVLDHLVGLHLALHLYVEYLETLSSWRQKRKGTERGEGVGREKLGEREREREVESNKGMYVTLGHNSRVTTTYVHQALGNSVEYNTPAIQ